MDEVSLSLTVSSVVDCADFAGSSDAPDCADLVLSSGGRVVVVE